MLRGPVKPTVSFHPVAFLPVHATMPTRNDDIQQKYSLINK
ncbi:hypothetical protein [Candidatus Rickettsia colombianensi]|nr:hypothetical protein [Candidatus Rickettsia colombianensi]